MHSIRYALFVLPLLSLAPARADFSYQTTSKMTGGQMMQIAAMGGSKATTPTAATVAIKGHKMAHVTSTGSMIIDTDAQTITRTNNDSKTYSVMTFEEMRNLMSGGNSRVDVSDVKVDVKDGDSVKTLLGHETHDKIMTIKSTVTDQKSGTKVDTVIHNDVYMAKGIAGSDELRDYYKKAGGLEWAQGGGAGMNQPGLLKAMTEAYKSAGTLEGLPLLTVMTIDGSMPGVDSSKMGALAAILAKRRQQPGTPAPVNEAPNALMQMTIEVTSYSDKAVDPALFQIPAGYAKTDSPLLRHGAR